MKERPSEPADAELETRLSELTRQLEDARLALLERERTWIAVLDAEHARVAQLLHDTLSQSLTAARMFARVNRVGVPQAAEDSSLQVKALEDLLEGTARECQDLTRWLAPARIEGANLIEVMAELAQLTSRTRPCEFHYSEGAIDAEPAAQVELLRIAQLALHALVAQRQGADTKLQLQLRCDEQTLIVEIETVESELPDFIEALLAMRARVLHGSFTVERFGEGRSTLSCRLPKHSSATDLQRRC